jgi:predicted DNA-binding WGR domain protein
MDSAVRRQLRLFRTIACNFPVEAISMAGERQWDGIPEGLELRRIRPEKNERRFYSLAITFDLFGGLLLTRNWGRIGTSGRQRLDLHSDLTDAREALTRLAQVKRKRGYQRR